jgi:hypothetical protein
MYKRKRLKGAEDHRPITVGESDPHLERVAGVEPRSIRTQSSGVNRRTAGSVVEIGWRSGRSAEFGWFISSYAVEGILGAPK